jgi:transposase
LMKLLQKGHPLIRAAVKAGMDVKTARRYRRAGKLPSETPTVRDWRTRPNPFADVWPEVVRWLESDPKLEAVTLFEEVCRTYPEKFRAGQVRTFQRHVRRWRISRATPKEVFFPQTHPPGLQAQVDFTHMTALGVTIDDEPFAHLFFHFTLTYSNWETGQICFSESYESLSDGLQSALWEVGRVPEEVRTDSLSAAVTLIGNRDEFTRRYQQLLNHYELRASHSSPGRGHENGDIEQSHHRFKNAVDQALRLRGHRDFSSRDAYSAFLRSILDRRNAERLPRLAEETARMRTLPETRLDGWSVEMLRVTRFSTITVRRNIYSVPSSLIGLNVEVRLFAQYLEVRHDGRLVERIERLRGQSGHRINYRHIIHSLLKKPGAFAKYRWRDDLFPRTIFRVAYDLVGDRAYVRLLWLAATVGEERVAETLRLLIDASILPTPEAIQAGLASSQPDSPSVAITAVDLTAYDQLLDGEETAL